MLYRAEGIVIRSMDYGEGNKIITLCTKESGKVGVLVRGAKKVKSRHAALTQLFTYGEYVFFRNGTGLGNLNAGEIMESHHGLREDLVKAAYASYACELLDRVLQDEETGAFWFHQLKACLEALQEDKDPQIIINLYEMKILQAAGYGPELDVCISCNQSRKDEDMLVSPRLGGVLCRYCKHLDPPAMAISPRTLKLLRLFGRLDLRRLGNVDVKDETKAELKKVMRALMDMQLGLRLKSQNFLDQMDKYNI
ncbi:DNA replication and repair protein RecO [Paenibacillus sp. cl141a]|uniref:DNA repair protein RecO n=1 Tax=Paenibacillus TaxID=44249 RepID=UPI0002072435|nr:MULTISPECIES: DNA repair protein RecO [unclassified Paenibacillus]EGG37222.1 DNA repair protein RecO [Paenibacillus sp. HGF5]SEM13061.1 DNA replication and repair protein RecO [Paenibacillus sp. cl141a]